ncbi:uncharacterized protein LOC118446665 [Vespa mandarinia]|uniref:uncharacterized protein LOC118446665 n=1 Tax=Vespa mandarinia TaxID=7446 RepID=UPI001613C276|nr:uncharacterized protein LOC118446665 [Vespa mandarinia]
MTHRKYDFNYFLAIFSEVLLILMTLSKMTTCWINRQALGPVTSMACGTVFYYLNELRLSVKMVIPNSSLTYKPPYKTETIVDIYDIKIYACFCIYQLFLLPAIILGYVGFDCLFANLAFHVTAQFGILCSMLKEILDDSDDFQRNMKELVLRHYKLIRQAKTLEDNFNTIILQQLMGTAFQLCASGYHTLLGSVSSEIFTVIVFNFYATNTLSTLFIYCYIGECLIQEKLEVLRRVWMHLVIVGQTSP